MKHLSLSLWSLFGLIGLSLPAAALSDLMIDPDDGMLDLSAYLSEKALGFMPVPIVITEPAVGNGLGVFGVFFHESEEQKAGKQKTSILPENITIGGGFATENDSKFAGFGHLGFWRKDTVRYKGFVGYPYVNLKFYSLAGQALANPLELNIKGPAVIQQLSFRLNDSHWFAGAYQTYQRMEMRLARDLNLDFLPTPGANEKLDDFLEEKLNVTEAMSGLGLFIEYDSRNNPMSPETGYNYRVRYLRFDDAIGSDAEYSNYKATGLNYWRINDRFNFALRLDYEGVGSTGGEPLAPYAVPGINLRGIPAARYQDQHIAVTEVEATWKLTPRWYLKGFTGAGFTAPTFSDLAGDAENVKSYGAGFRYLIAKRYGFTMGADIARGPEDTAFYIQAGSSW